MKKIFILAFTLSLFGCSNSDEISKVKNYYFSENATNCAYIFYNVEGAEPLTMKERTVNYHFNEQNIITTSSSYNFGWKYEDGSGPNEVHYFKGNTKLEGKVDINSAKGSYTLEGVEYHYEELYLDKTATSCFSEDTAEDNESFRNLIKNIFSK